ncbi:hypothetical protein [Saccharopolyspora pogona]|uniref:hypothetical protein n=1 Tax=Saccharopolyspora pogona TaxID=333966 RepID=UPI0016853299|nr:hypothetical protein [Saccharopolyspora pogona]
MESIQQSLVPKIRLPKFTLPESTLKNIAAISRVAETQQAMVAHAIKPFLDAQSAWQKQFAVINSDIFKSHALAQSNLNLIASQLIRNVDFGITESAASAAAKFAAQQATWLENIAPALAAMYAAVYPPNLRSIGGSEA